MENIVERLAKVEENNKSNAQKIITLEKKTDENERIVNNIDKSLSVTMEQIRTIAEDLKQTSINFKEAIVRSNAANSKETEILKEKYNDLEKKYEKLNNKLEQETIIKDANNWRNSKSKIISWVITGVLALIAGVLGLSKYFG